MDHPDPATAFTPVSLGYSCEVKYQLSRVLYERRHPQGHEDDFRRSLMTPELGQQSFERHVFDWQIVPFEAVLGYLEADFQGVFEREDLQAINNDVEHRRLKTRHPHDFHPLDGVLDEQAIDRGYAAARSKFEHLAAKFRRLLNTPGPHLYVFRQIRIYDDAVRLLQLLSARNPQHQPKLLFVDAEGQDQTLTALEGEVFRGWLPLQPDKPDHRRWEGDDAGWTRILAPFNLRLDPPAA
jgi:hypothetical protein